MNTKVRVLFVTSSTEPWGAEHSLRTLLGSAPDDFSCSLLASSQVVADYCRPFVKELHVVPQRQAKLQTLSEFGKAIAEMKNQYEVIVLFSLKLLPLASVIRVRWPNVCVVADVHDAPIQLDRLLSRILLESVNGSIAISRFVVQHLKLRKVTIVPRPMADSLNPRDYDAVRESSSEVVLGIIGRIDPEKRIEVAIDAMRFLPSRFKLQVYGDPCIAGEDYARSLSDSASRSAQTVFRGRMTPEEIYDEVDGVIVCNEREPSGRTVGEAMLREKLVFAPDRGGAQEFFDDSMSGFVYRALNAESLAAAIASAFEVGRDTRLVRQRARAKILAERSPQAVAANYFKALGLIARI